MSEPDEPRGQESIWARLEREDREDAERARGPMRLFWTGFLLLSIANLARQNGRTLTGAAFWVVVCVASGLAVAGLVLAWSRRRRS